MSKEAQQADEQLLNEARAEFSALVQSWRKRDVLITGSVEFVPLHKTKWHHVDTDIVQTIAGFTGDICPNCGSPNMVQNGTCKLCQNCGQTTGCA